jgi:hypothetical protein
MAAQTYSGLYKDDSPQAMVEADQAYSAFTASNKSNIRPGALMVLARQQAQRLIKEQWLAEGRKLQSTTLAELREAADAYLARHPECFRAAAEMIERSPRLRKIAEREERDRLRAQLRTSAK